MDHLRDHFLIDPDVTFLNHGSFGATPRPVFEVYQEWQRRLEYQPVDFMTNQLQPALTAARQRLARYVGSGDDDLFFVPNATFGVNIAARSLDLGPDDEVLTSDQEYGACLNSFIFLSKKRGFKIVEQHIPLPLATAETVLEQFWAGVTSRTKVIFLSHITSATAQRFPIEAICQRARAAGILTLIDGAHAPGQIELNLAQIGADFYTGNCHKWLSSPKGAAFFHARPESQHLVEPLVVGWGYGDSPNVDYGSRYLNSGTYLGTNDLSAYLAVPAAIAFQEEHNWADVRAARRAVLAAALLRMGEITGYDPLYQPLDQDQPGLQLGIFESVRPEIRPKRVKRGVDWGVSGRDSGHPLA